MWITLKFRLLTLFFVVNCLLPALSFAQTSATESPSEPAAAVKTIENTTPSASSAPA